jgi:tripartite-type tricarboxylate transporter receptor subunit TctC
VSRTSIASTALRWISVVALAASSLVAQAAFPDRPVKLVVAGPPAGGTDFLARLVADELSRAWKQPVVVENRAGASGLIGTRFVQTAPPDGYTLILGHAATHAIVPAMHQPPPYDPIANFTPISLVATAPDLLVVAADSPDKSVADLIARARAKPGSVTYGSPGIGLPQHLLGHRLAQVAGVSMLHVPYKGSNPALTELIGGQLQSMFVTSGAVMPFIKTGRVRALAVNSARRMPDLPDVPTFAELGMPQLQQAGWFGVFGPAGMAPDVVTAINAAIAKIVTLPQVRAKMATQYFDPVGGSPEQFAAFHREEVKRWAAIVRESGVRPD